jgi:hypothetical protein
MFKRHRALRTPVERLPSGAPKEEFGRMIFQKKSSLGDRTTARSVEDETRNGHRNAKRNPNRNQETTVLDFSKQGRARFRQRQARGLLTRNSIGKKPPALCTSKAILDFHFFGNHEFTWITQFQQTKSAG